MLAVQAPAFAADSSTLAELTGRLCWALWLYWLLRGRLSVGRRYAERALARPAWQLTREMTAQRMGVALSAIA